MVKIRINVDEWYPVFSLLPEGEDWKSAGQGVEVPEEFVQRYHKTLDEFNAVQDELRVLGRFYEP